ncbi:hypothetical protein O181_112675 [Austropuccinia psidii MF-1]|uniref:Peptidase A2 domain-containing protein n=1 Tax=Austropuccinia psidii MF-1 TaxID=1389203 RepID=A0A9Q3PTS1_9BASI|nr:hypothetical protein [Austropuccinia psidii MF-1]
MALVDTGSEINIIPEEIAIKASLTSRKLNVNLRGIGEHKTSLVGLSEFTPTTMITGKEKEIHLFIGKGAVHTILGRPFLAANNVKLEFSHMQGKIFSYPEQDGHQLCLPICNLQSMEESSKRREAEETESQSSTRVTTIFVGPNKIPFSAIFDAKNDLIFITQERAQKAELNISPYTSKSTDNSFKPIGQIKNLEVTFESEKTYLDFLVFDNFNQIIVEENSSILSSSKESMPIVTHIKSKGQKTENKLEVEDSEAIEKIKEELNKSRRNLDMAIEDPEKCLALELSGMNQEEQRGSPQKKFKMDLKPPEANSSRIAEDYFNLFQEETGYISDTEKDLISEEPKDSIIKPVAKQIEELEKESAVIIEDKMDQVWGSYIKKGIEQRMEIVPEGKLVESEDKLKLFQQNNGNWEDRYKQSRIFEDLEEGDLSENTQTLAGLAF